MIAVYIDPKLEKFASEVKYTFSFIFKTLGFEFKFISKIEQLLKNDILFYYGLIKPTLKEANYIAAKKAIFYIPVNANLLSPGKLNRQTLESYVQNIRIKSKIPIIAKERIQYPVQYFYKEDLLYSTFNFDIIGNIFFNLIGYDEFINNRKNNDDNKVTDDDQLFIKFSTTPYVNHLLWLIENCLIDAVDKQENYFLLKKEYWPGAESFGGVITHSVNSLRKWNFKKIIKNTLQDLTQIWKIKYIYKNSLSKIKYLLTNIEEYWNFDLIEEIENKHQIFSTYFFGSVERTELDVDYCVNDKYVNKEIMNKLHQGNEISLLASSISHKNDVLANERERLENATGQKHMGIRHYKNNFDPQITTEYHKKNGFDYDSSHSFIHTIGFKHGLGFPYHLYQLENSGKKSKFHYQSRYFELPIIFSDEALKLTNSRTVSLEKSKDYVDKILNEINKTNGFLSFDFSVSNFSDIPFNKELMTYVVEQIRPMDAYITTCIDLINWWRKRESVEISESEHGLLVFFPESIEKFTFRLFGKYRTTIIEGAEAKLHKNKIIFSNIKADTKVQILLEKIDNNRDKE